LDARFLSTHRSLSAHTPLSTASPLSLHDALPISVAVVTNQTPFYAESGGQVGDTGTMEGEGFTIAVENTQKRGEGLFVHSGKVRSEEHTSELQSRENLVCRLLLEKKKSESARTCN